MAGDIRTKERAIATLTTAGASLTAGSAGAANGTADLDARSGGNVPNDRRVRIEWVGQWATVTGITAGMIVAEVYAVPALDGTNFADIDSTSGASRLPSSTLVGYLETPKAPTANTNIRLVTHGIDLDPLLHRVYIRNISGQTMSANWSAKVVGVQDQYT